MTCKAARGSKPGPRSPCQSLVLHGCRVAQRTVSSDERSAITGECGGCRRGSGNGDSFAELRLVGVAGKQALALQIPFCDYVHPAFLVIGSKDKRGVRGDR